MDADHELVVIVGEGIVGYPEFTALWDGLRVHPACPMLGRYLYDLRDCTALLEPGDVDSMVEQEQMQAPLLGGKRVAVVSAVAVTYGTARMFQLRGEPTRNYEMEVFRTLADANAWLQRVDAAQ